MEFVLKRLHEEDNARIVLERNRSYTCGRGKENDIICLSLLVSRRHCIFFRDNENLYITDLRSSNGIFINDEEKKSPETIKLYENDIIGIGCPTTDPSNETLYIYKVCIIKSPILDEEEEETNALSKTVLNNNTMQRSISPVSSENHISRKRCVPKSNCDVLPPKKSKVTCDERHNSSSSKEVNSDLSHDNQNPHNSKNTNYLKSRCDTVDTNSEDDIEIIHTSLIKERKKKDIVSHNRKSAKYSNGNNKSDSDERMDISSIENNNDDDDNCRNISKNYTRKTLSNIDKQDDTLSKVHFTEKSNFRHKDNQITKYENEMQDTDEEVHMAAECDKSPIKLKKIRHEPKTRFSEIDVVDLSDDEEGVFPYSQLFDIKYEDNTENRMKIKQECINDDELNIEKIGLLNVDDEVIILTDSEDEDNPWLERLSRSQLVNEDIKPVMCNAIVKDEIDLGIWDDEIPIIEQSEIPSTSKVPPSKEISSPKLHASVDIQTKSKKDDFNMPTEVNAMDVDEIGSSNEPSTKDIDKRKQIVDININLPTTEANMMDVDEVGPSNKSSTKDIESKRIVDINIKDKSKQIVDTNIHDKNKQKTDAKQSTILDKQKTDAKQSTILDKQKTDAKQSTILDKQKTDAKQSTILDKQTELESLKQKLIAKSISKKLIPVIEPLNLPVRKKHTDLSKVIKVHKTSPSKSTTKEKTVSKLKEKLNDNVHNKEQRRYKKKSKSMFNNGLSSIIKSGSSISKDEKKKIIEDRKMKLKKIAAEEKKLVAESDQSTYRRIAKPRAKISLKNRGDFLIAEQEPRVSKSLPDKSAKSSANQSNKGLTDKADVIKKSATSDIRKSHEKTDVSKDSVNNIAASLQQSLYLDSTASEESTLSVKATNDNKKKHSSSRSSSKDSRIRSNANGNLTVKMPELRAKLVERSSVIQKENFSPNSLKSSLRRSTKKKTVSFSDKFEIKVYEIDNRNTLKKLDGKDAPIPTNKLTRPPVVYTDWKSPKLEEFLLRIFMWNPVWLEEQRYLNQEPPIVSENDIHAMRLSYDSYRQYYEFAMPLLLLEIWHTMTKDFEMIQKNMQRRTMMCLIVKNSITRTPIPSTDLFLTTLTFDVLVTKDDINKQTHPIYGDLVYLEYVTNVRDKQIFRKIFGYITNMQHMIITDSYYNRDLRNYVKNPHSVITYTLLTRPLEHNISINKVQRVRTVMYLRANIRMVQALQYLPQSTLLNLIVTPKIEDYQLSPLNGQYKSSSLVTKDNLNPKQLEAVFKVTDVVVKKEAKLCFIQGPPGTGKSKVIVNLVTQILYGNRPDKKAPDPGRILICAPSNAAIDEVVLRLLTIRSTLKQKQYFNMVRIGRSESMHPLVKTISPTELAKRHLQKLTRQRSGGYLANAEEIAVLQARINALESEFNNTSKLEEAKRNSLKNKLLETSARCEILISGKSIDEISPKDRAKYQRMSENAIITGANIIACTLSSCYTNQMESIFGSHKDNISVCIVDEATQSCEAETLIPLMLGVNTLVLVGDPNQLPATILSQRAKRLGLDQSLFSRMQKVFGSQSNSPIIMLDTQYRMDYAISYWPNKYFYNGKLKNAAECRTKFPFHAYRVLCHKFTQNNDKFSNTIEAELVANIIYTMLTCKKWETNDTISLGVLTPYNNQRTLVLNKINEKISNVSDDLRKKISFEVNTVDGFQGQERDVIIMSCVRSHGIGFLSDRQRLCVALTRAKHSLILCGNFNTFMKDQMWDALLKDARSRGIFCEINNNTPDTIKQFIVK